MAPSEIDFYKILNIGRYATDDDIKKAFRKAGWFPYCTFPLLISPN